MAIRRSAKRHGLPTVVQLRLTPAPAQAEALAAAVQVCNQAATLVSRMAWFVVREAERTGSGVALEDLQGIRGRVRAHRLQRRTLHNWAFAQQITFTRYEAARAGVAFILVDPAYTSQACPERGCVARANRPARGRFVCTRCGLAGHADHIAARNIATRGVAGWAAVNQPHATGLPSPRRDRESKPPASTGGS
jgi:putative transposase